jgi:hypothetical protein
MKGIGFLLLFMLSIGCTQVSNEATTPVNQPEEEPQENQEPFSMEIQLQRESLEEYTLNINLGLKPGNYIVSHFSKDSVYGHFEISFDHEYLKRTDSLQEKPSSVEEYDSIVNMPVRFVRRNTVFKQNLVLETEEDFDMPGLIYFVLEPSCVPYEVGFVISHRKSKMSVRKVTTEIASSYFSGKDKKE